MEADADEDEGQGGRCEAKRAKAERKGGVGLAMKNSAKRMVYSAFGALSLRDARRAGTRNAGR